MDTPFLHEALAQHFNPDELKLLCVSAGVDPDSVPFSERGKEIYAYCIVDIFRKKDQLTVLIAACASSRDHVDWGACRIATTVPAEWVGLFAAQRALEALHQLPAPPDNFVGRQNEIDQLCASIRANAASDTPSAILSSIEGMGGVGKTALALIVAHHLLANFPDAQLFIQLNANGLKPLTSTEARDQVLRSYYPEARLPDDEAELNNLYRSTLANQRGLIIFDDARDDDHIRLLLPPAGWAVLITSRNTLATGKHLRLHELPRADSIQLLCNLAVRITEAQAGDLAEACGDLPVALRLVGADLKRFIAKPVAIYARELRANRAGKLKLSDVFSYSFAQLTAQQQAALGALSVMPASFHRVTGEAVINQPDHPDLLDELLALNWLEYDEATERFDWHDLLRDFVTQQTPQGIAQIAAFRHTQHFTQVAYVSNRLYLAGNESNLQGLALFDRERLHLNAAFAFLTSVGAADDAKARATALVDLVHAVAYISDLRFHPRERIRWLNAQLAACRLVDDRRGEGAALGNLGVTYRNLGEPRRAIELYEQQLAIAREIGDREDEGAALGNLGNAYANLGESRRAIELYEQRLAIAREIGDCEGEGTALGNLGNTYANLGEVRRAIEFYEQQLAITREIGDRRGVGTTLGNLGVAYANLGEVRRAIEFYEQQLAITREIGDRHGEGAALGNLGVAHHSLGEVRRAIKLYEQLLAITREIGDRRGEGAALGNLGVAYSDLGEPHQAVELYEQQLAITREIGDRRGEGAALGNLGNIYVILGQPAPAIELYEQQLVIVREIGDRRGESDALGNLGVAYADLGQPARAIELHEKRLVIAREIGDRRGEGTALGNLGNAYASLGELPRAIELYEQRLVVIAREIGDRSGEGAALRNLGNAYARSGELVRAIELYEQALVITREIGDRSGEANTSWNLGVFYAAAGNLTHAIELLQVCVDYEREIGHPNAEKRVVYIDQLRASLAGNPPAPAA